MLNRSTPRFKSALGSLSKRPIHSHVASEEDFSRYCIGGYHPVRIGDSFSSGRYVALRKLGYGVYSTVWLASDQRTNQPVALKILTADSYGTSHDTFELDILRHIRNRGSSHAGSAHVLDLLDDFEHRGPHGNHVCLVCKAKGPDMVRYRRLFPKARIPLPRMKAIAKQLLLALDFLHSTCGVIHSGQYATLLHANNASFLTGVTDIKPQNILLDTPAINELFATASSQAFTPQLTPFEPPNDFYRQSEQVSSGQEDLAHATDVSIQLADFGTASRVTKHLTEWTQPQMLRAPEVILGAEWNTMADIWNVGLVIWELAEGSLVFDGTWTATAPYTAEAHLAQMEAVLGRIPKSLLARSKNRHLFFDADGKLLTPSTFPPLPLERICRNPQLSISEKALFLDFIRSMVKIEPQERLCARELLDAQWLQST